MELYGILINHMAASPVNKRGNTRNPITFKTKSSLPIQILHRDLSLAIWAFGSFDGSPENKPLAVSIYIKKPVTMNICLDCRGVGQEFHQNLQCSRCPYSNTKVMGLLEVFFSQPLSIGSQLVPDCMPQLVMEVAGLLHHPNSLY